MVLPADKSPPPPGIAELKHRLDEKDGQVGSWEHYKTP